MLKNHNYLYGPITDASIPVNNNFGDYFLRRLLKQRNTVAFTNAVTGSKLTYSQIAQEAMNIAVSLTHLGVRKGDTVALCTENREEFWATLLGVVCTGAVFTPYNPGYANGIFGGRTPPRGSLWGPAGAREFYCSCSRLSLAMHTLAIVRCVRIVEMKHIISISKPSYIFCSPTAFEAHQHMFRTLNLKNIIVFGEKRYKNTLLYNDIAIAANETATDKTATVIDNKLTRNVSFEEFIAADVNRNDVVFILYSSGTTGMPKGVMLEHYNIITTCCVDPIKYQRTHVLVITPWFHAMGLIGNLVGLASGISFVTLPKFEVDLYLKTIETYKVDHIVAVPPMLVAIAKSSIQYDLTSVKKITCGAAPLSKDIIEAIRKKFCSTPGVAQGYGMTELSIICISDHIEGKLRKPGSVGKVIAYITVKIVDIDSREVLGEYIEGEICIKGAMVMKGYVGKDRRDDFDDEGFFKTGDIGYYDEEGYVYIVDRLKELIKYNTYQVAPAEIEAVLLQHEAVRDAGVVGLYDENTGEVPVAFIVTQPDKSVTEKELQDFVAGKLSNPKRLRGGVRFIPEIPKNPTGKILRKVLKVMAENSRSKL